MRIVYILTSLGIGGAEKQVIDLAERLAVRGHSVSLLVLKYTEEEWPTKLPVLRLNLRKTPMSVARGLRFAQSFLSIVRPEILHSHTFPANIFARFLRFLMGRSATPPILINTIHNVHEGGWHRMLLYRLTSLWVDAVTAVSSAAAARFTETKAVPRQKMTVLTNGIDTDAFLPDARTRKRIRAKMQAGEDFIWLAVGRIAPAKDYPNLLKAFTLVKQTQSNTRLWIAGEGDPFNDPHLSRAIHEYNAGVEMLGLRRDIKELLDGADGLVLSSAWEGMPLAVGEAMAMGKLVAATNVGGVQELLGDKGTIVPSRNSEALAHAMLQLMTLTEKERSVIAHATRDRILTNFSLRAKTTEWEALYAHHLQRRIV